MLIYFVYLVGVVTASPYIMSNSTLEDTREYMEYYVVSHPTCYSFPETHDATFPHICEGRRPDQCDLIVPPPINCSINESMKPIRLLYSTLVFIDRFSRAVLELTIRNLEELGRDKGLFFEIIAIQGDCSQRTISERMGKAVGKLTNVFGYKLSGVVGPLCIQDGDVWLSNAILPYDLTLITPLSTKTENIVSTDITDVEAIRSGLDTIPYVCRIRMNDNTVLLSTVAFLYTLNWMRIGVLEDGIGVTVSYFLQESLEALGGDGYQDRRVTATDVLNMTEHIELARSVKAIDAKIFIHLGLPESILYQICGHLSLVDYDYDSSVFGRHRINYIEHDISAPSNWLNTTLESPSRLTTPCQNIGIFNRPLLSVIQLMVLTPGPNDQTVHGIIKSKTVESIENEYNSICLSTFSCSDLFLSVFEAFMIYYSVITENTEEIAKLNRSTVYSRIQYINYYGMTGQTSFISKHGDCERVGLTGVLQTSIENGMFMVAEIIPLALHNGRRLDDDELSSIPEVKFTQNMSSGSGKYESVDMLYALKNNLTDSYPKAFATCQLGQYFDYDEGECTDCRAGTFSADLYGRVCMPCPPGRFSDVEAYVEVTNLRPGTECTGCPFGTIQPNMGGINCTNCPPGTSWLSSVECGDCRPGSYTDGANRDFEVNCIKCPRGTYQSAYRATSCQSCALAIINRGPLSTMEVSSTGIGDCGCSPGYYIPCLDPPRQVIENRDSKSLLNSCNSHDLSYDSTKKLWTESLVSKCAKSKNASVDSFEHIPKHLSCIECPPGFTCPGGFKHIQLREDTFEVHSPPILIANHMSMLTDPYFAISCATGNRESQCPGETDIPCTCMKPFEQTGPACSVCRGNAVMTTDGVCQDCVAGAPVIASFVFILGLFILVILAYYICNSPVTADATTLLVVAVTFGMLTTFIQSLAIFSMLTVNWPDSVTTFLKSFLFSVASFDFLNLGCTVPKDNSVVLRIMIIGIIPFLFIIVISACWYLTNHLRFKKKKRVDENSNDSGFSGTENEASDNGYYQLVKPWTVVRSINTFGCMFQAFFILFISLAAVSFTCYAHPDGDTKSLQAYPFILCGSGDHIPILILGVLITVFYVIGFYSLCLWAIWVAPEKSCRSAVFISTFRFLFYRFRPDRYYWGAVVLLRSTLITFSSVIIPDNPNSQCIFLVAVIAGFLMAQVRFWPWKTRLLNICDVCVFSVLLLFITLGTVFVPASNSNGYIILAIILLCLCFLIIGVILCIGVYTLVLQWQSIQKHKKTIREHYLDETTRRSLDVNKNPFTDPKLELLAQNWSDLIHYLSVISGGSVAHTSYLRIFGEYDRKKINETTYLIFDTLPEMFFAIANKCDEKGPAYLQYIKGQMGSSTGMSLFDRESPQKNTTEATPLSPRRVTTADVVSLNQSLRVNNQLQEETATPNVQDEPVPVNESTKVTLTLNIPNNDTPNENGTTSFRNNRVTIYMQDDSTDAYKRNLRDYMLRKQYSAINSAHA